MSLLDKYKERQKKNTVAVPEGNATAGSLLEIYKQRTGQQGEQGAVAPVKESTPWYKSGAFADGYDVGDITKYILGVDDQKTRSRFNGIVEDKDDAEQMLSTMTSSEINQMKKSAQTGEEQRYYDDLTIQKQVAEIEEKLSKVILENGTTLLEEVHAVASMEDGKEKKARKEELKKQMFKAKVNPDMWYSMLTGDKNITWTTAKKFASNAFNKGLNAFNTSLTGFLDVTAGNLLKGLGWENNPISKLDDYYEDLYANYSHDLELTKARMGAGGWADGLGNFTEATVAALPQAIMAIATAGGSTTTQLSTTAAQACGTILQNAGISAQQMLKNPQYWMSFVTTYANDYEDAKKNGADDLTAGFSATITSMMNAGVEVGGGIQILPGNLKGKGNKAITEWVKSTLEEGEEGVVQRIISDSIAKGLYDSDREIVKPGEMLQEFGMGMGVGGVLGGSQVVTQSAINATSNAIAEREANQLTENEQKVVEKVYEDELAEREKNGKLSAREKTKLYESVIKEMEQGRISTDTIERVLGGDTYKGYQSLVEQEKTLTERQKALQAEIDALQDADNTIRNNKKLQEAEAEMEKLTEQLKSLDVKSAKSNLFSEVDKLTAKDTKLRESYNERTRRGQAFTADLTKYDAKLRPTIQRAIDNGEINNTRATHAFVEGLAKIEAEKGIGFDFTNNERLAELGLTVAGRNVGGYVDGTNVTLNLSSSEALNKVVGHEVTHVFEGSGQYDALMAVMKEFAAEKGIDWDARVQEMTERYQNVKNADPEKELLADLVGEYLFTDSGFVKSLSTKNPGLFKKIYEEIKYLAKTFAGTKQGAALEKVKKTFADMYRDVDVKNTGQTDGVKYAIKNNMVDTNGTVYGKVVKPGLKIYQNVKHNKQNYVSYLRSKIFKRKFIVQAYDNTDITVEFAKENERVKKDGDKTLRRALGELEATADRLKMIAIINIRDLIKNSTPIVPKMENSHQWLDANGWNDRVAYMEDNNKIYPVYIHIAKTRDGRYLLYDVSVIKDEGSTVDIDATVLASSNDGRTSATHNNESKPAVKSIEPSFDKIAQQKMEVKKFFLSETKDTAPAGEYRITGEDIALAPTKEDIAAQEIAMAQDAPRNAFEELGAPTREDITRMERDKKLKGPLLMKDSLDRELEKLYRLQQTGKIQGNAYFAELLKANEAYQTAGRDFNEAFSRVVEAYQGEVATNEESTAVNTDPAIHTPEEQTIIEEYQAAVDEELVNYVEKVKANPGAKNGRYTLKNVSDRAAADIKKLTGVDVEGNKTQIEGRIVEHILKRHGENGKADQSMRDVNDIARIQYVLDNYDNAEYSGKSKGYVTVDENGKSRLADTVTFSKKVNGTYYVVEAVPDTKSKTVFIVSARMAKNGQKTTQQSLNPVVQKPPAKNVQDANENTAVVPGTTVPTNTVPQNEPAVKQEEVEAVLGEKGAYVSKQANALYDEVKSMQKGKRVSNTLSYLLDTLDLSEENKAESYNSLRTALLNIRDNPNQVVNPNSAVEAAAREMLGREYDSMAEDFASAEGVAKDIYTKMESLRTELENNQSLREQSNADFDREIARLQAEYEGKKNKNTKAANDILRRIERVQRLKSQVDADYGKRIDRLGEQLERISKPEYKTAMQRKAKMEEYTNLVAELVGDTSTWVDKKLGLSYSINTLRRNLRDIVRDSKGNRDIAKADAIYDEFPGKYNHNEADLKREDRRIKSPFEELKPTHAEEVYAHMLGEFQYNPESKLSQERLEEYYEKHKDKIDTKKVEKYIDEAMKTLDELFVRLNKRLREQGMKEIPYRKGYFPHFTNPKQGPIAKIFNWKPVDNEIPTSIAGLTEEFNPQRSWQSFDKQRTSDDTDYNLSQALDTYIHGALDWIYHIEDIQKRRALENYIRYVHSDEGIKKRIDEIRNNESYDADEAQELIDAVYAEAKNPLNNFVSDLRTGTNTLANKKSSLDRKAEEMTNRKIYSVMTNLNSRINANMVVGSFSSALTNFIPITQSWMEVSPVYSLKGMRDTIKSTIRDDGVVNKSDFLTNRLMNEEKLYQTGWDKVSEKAGFMMEAIDNFTSQTVWRSKYLQNMAEGMSETEAIKNADQFAENVIAGRSRGNQPTIFDAKNPLTKIFTAFQLEVANQYGYMFKDAPQDAKNKGQLIKGYATAFMGAYAYNALYSSLVGRDAAFDPLSILEDLFRDLFGDDEEEPEEAILNLADNVLEEVPFIGGLMGGGRVPISSAIPYEGDYKTLITDLANKKFNEKEWLKPLYYLAMPVAGGQLKKTNEGLKMFDEDLPVAGSYTESGNLRFPVEDDSIADWLKAALFGQYASKNAREYFDNGWTPLKEKQIEEFASLDIPIADYREIRKQLGKLNTLGEKLAYIHTLDLPVSKKNILANNQADRKEPIDMADWGDLDEFDYAVKYPEKSQFLIANGISAKEYNNFDDETKDAYDWAYQNPEKYAVSKAVSDDIVNYRTYTKELSEIKADKDSKGNAVSGSRKKKVVQQLNGLDMEYGAKLVLYKLEYPSDDTYNGKIIEYVNGIEGFTYEQKATVLKELGFTVTADGRVTWN